MEPMTHIQRVEVADLLHHADHGFAWVEERTDEGLRLAWSRSDVPTSTLFPASRLDELQLCVPGGFMDKAQRCPDEARDLVQDRPLHAVERLLDDLGGAASPEELTDWLGALGLLPAAQASAWRERVLARVKRGERRDQLRWADQRLEQVDDRAITAPLSFMGASPSLRWNRWIRSDAKERLRLTAEVAAKGDASSLRLVLRGDNPIPKSSETQLLQRVLARDLTVASALLRRAHAGATAALARMAGLRAQRSFIRNVLFTIPSTQRTIAVMQLIEAALSGDGGDLAALYLGDQLPSGPEAALRQLKGTTTGRGLPLAVDWLRSRLSEATMDRPSQAAEPLLTQIRPMPPGRLFPVSIALARALAERHATGSFGGIAGARWTSRDAVELGVPEHSDPQTDVRDAMRLLAELAVGELPRGSKVADEVLLAHFAELVPLAPPEWVAVLIRSLSAVLTHRPWDALDLWEQLAQAQATADVRAAAPRRGTLSLQLGYDSHIGHVKARGNQTNQDALFFQQDGATTLLLLGDGISVATAGSGDLASALLVQVLSGRWDAAVPDLTGAGADACRDFLEMALAEANQTICEASTRLAGGDLSRHIPMGTTALAAVIHHDEVIMASLGDSPAWLVGSFGATRLTADQNVRGRWLRSWQRHEPVDLTTEGNALVGYCGHFDDKWRPAPIVPQFAHVRLLPGETLVLTSDGFSDYAATTTAELAALVEAAVREDDLSAGCRMLIDRANAGGGGDNITVLAARVVGASAPGRSG